MASMFKRGFNAVNEEKQRQEEQRNRGNGLFRFYLKKDKEEADITFLTEQPVNFFEHTIKKYANGKEIYESIPCIGDGCKHCADGDRPSFKSAWLIIDHREYSYKDKDGNTKTGRDQVRLLVYGTKVASQLDRKSERYGLMGRIYTVVRLGSGTSTTYTFEHGDKYSLTRQEIEEILPDSIKELYDGTTDSFYNIIEQQILMLVENAPKEDTPDTTAHVDEEIVPVDEPVKKRGIPRRTKTENSVRPSVKSILKKKITG